MEKNRKVDRLRAVALSGSLRKGSYNRKALKIAKVFAENAGAEVTEIDLKELALPAYDEDLVASGVPEPVQKLKAAIESADVLLIATPEYNYSIPGGLKNAIDWASKRPNSFDGKVAAIFGASTGPFGTIRMQPHLRQVLAAVNVLIVPQPQVHIRSAADAFNPDGSLKDPKINEQLRSLVEKSMRLARLLQD